eukprot:SM000275S10325  [mRNA]  locus=s275:54227:62225:- [translate_table: standard]
MAGVLRRRERGALAEELTREGGAAPVGPATAIWAEWGRRNVDTATKPFWLLPSPSTSLLQGRENWSSPRPAASARAAPPSPATRLWVLLAAAALRNVGRIDAVVTMALSEWGLQGRKAIGHLFGQLVATLAREQPGSVDYAVALSKCLHKCRFHSFPNLLPKDVEEKYQRQDLGHAILLLLYNLAESLRWLGDGEGEDNQEDGENVWEDGMLAVGEALASDVMNEVTADEIDLPTVVDNDFSSTEEDSEDEDVSDHKPSCSNTEGDKTPQTTFTWKELHRFRFQEPLESVHLDGNTTQERTALEERTGNLHACLHGLQSRAMTPAQCITEAAMVRHVLHMMQGLPSDILTWDKGRRQFVLRQGICFSHLSSTAVLSSLQHLMAAASSLQRVQAFVDIVIQSTYAGHGSGIFKHSATIQAFAEAMSAQLQHANLLHQVLRNLSTEEEATGDVGAATLLSGLYNMMTRFCWFQDSLGSTYSLLLQLFMATMQPMVTYLHAWLYKGVLLDIGNEFLIKCKAEVNASEAPISWWRSHTLRKHDKERPGLSSSSISSDTKSSGREMTSGDEYLTLNDVEDQDDKVLCPSFLKPYAQKILYSGTSLRFLQQVRRTCPQDTQMTMPVSCAANLLQATAGAIGDSELPRMTQEGSLKTIPLRSEEPVDVKEVSVCCESTMDSENDNMLLRDFCSTLQEPTEQSRSDSRNPKTITTGHQDNISDYHDIADCEVDTRKRLSSQHPDLLPQLSFTTPGPGSLSSTPQVAMGKAAETALVAHCEKFQLPALLLEKALLRNVRSQICVIEQRLLSCFMKDWRLCEELSLLRSLYLLPSGDLLQTFTEKLFVRLDIEQAWDDDCELNALLQVVYGPDRTIMRVLHTDVEGCTAQIDLIIRMPWAVRLIVSEAACLVYNEVMVFLMKVKRAKYALSQVRRSSWKSLLMSARIHKLLGVALEYCKLSMRLRSIGELSDTVLLDEELLLLEDAFDKGVTFMLRVLSSKQYTNQLPHLADLLTGLNFNNYYISADGSLRL